MDCVNEPLTRKKCMVKLLGRPVTFKKRSQRSRHLSGRQRHPLPAAVSGHDWKQVPFGDTPTDASHTAEMYAVIPRIAYTVGHGHPVEQPTPRRKLEASYQSGI